MSIPKFDDLYNTAKINAEAEIARQKEQDEAYINRCLAVLNNPKIFDMIQRGIMNVLISEGNQCGFQFHADEYSNSEKNVFFEGRVYLNSEVMERFYIQMKEAGYVFTTDSDGNEVKPYCSRNGNINFTLHLP